MALIVAFYEYFYLPNHFILNFFLISDNNSFNSLHFILLYSLFFGLCRFFRTVAFCKSRRIFLTFLSLKIYCHFHYFFYFFLFRIHLFARMFHLFLPKKESLILHFSAVIILFPLFVTKICTFMFLGNLYGFSQFFCNL